MNITFHGVDGRCPHFLAPNGVNYIIRDQKVGSDYQYYLTADSHKPKVLKFESNDDVDAFIDGKTDRRRYSVAKIDDKIGYFMNHVTIIKENKTVTLRYTPDVVSGMFESYVDCLNFAKEYVAGEIEQFDMMQNRQMDMTEFFTQINNKSEEEWERE